MGPRDKVVHILESYVSIIIHVDKMILINVSPQVRRYDRHGVPRCQQRDLRLWNLYPEPNDPAFVPDIQVMFEDRELGGS